MDPRPEPDVRPATRRVERSERRAHGGKPRGQRGKSRRDREPDPSADLGPEADPESFARQILLRRLTDQPRTRADLAEQLAKRNVPDDVANAVLDRFEEVGLIDDEEYARSWVQSRQRSHGLASRAIAQELRRKGIDDGLVKDTVAEIDPDDEEEIARQLVRKKLRSLRNVDDAAKVRRLAGMLARKGYSSGVAFRVVREEIGAEAHDRL